MKFLTINQRIQEIASRVFGNGASGQDTASSSNTSFQLNGGTSQSVPRGAELVVKALGGNGSNVYVGFSSSVNTSNGLELEAGSAVTLSTSDVSNVYVYGQNSGDGVSWITESE